MILTYNPDYWRWPDHDQVARRAHPTTPVPGSWNVGSRTRLPPGTTAWLLQQGRHRGLLGYAVTTSDPYPDEHFADPGRIRLYVDLAWLDVVPADDLLPTDVLRAQVPDVPWNGLRTSGVVIPTAASDALDRVWADHRGPQR